MEQLSLEIKREQEFTEEDSWDFDNFDWLKGDPDSLRIFFAKAIPRLKKLIIEYPRYKDRYKKLLEDCHKRLDQLRDK